MESDWPLFWFAQLESAVERGDVGEAAWAAKQLDRLGIEVRFKFPMITWPVKAVADAKP